MLCIYNPNKFWWATLATFLTGKLMYLVFIYNIQFFFVSMFFIAIVLCNIHFIYLKLEKFLLYVKTNRILLLKIAILLFLVVVCLGLFLDTELFILSLCNGFYPEMYTDPYIVESGRPSNDSGFNTSYSGNSGPNGSGGSGGPGGPDNTEAAIAVSANNTANVEVGADNFNERGSGSESRYGVESTPGLESEGSTVTEPD
jgi:hypothetical protein